MSIPETVEVRCSKCKVEQEFTIWNSVNVTADPNLKSRLLSGELFDLLCVSCGASTTFVYDMLYHDMEKEMMLWLKPPLDSGFVAFPIPAIQMVRLFQPNYTRRLVVCYNELREKVLLYDDGYDDLTIEIIKLMVSLKRQIDVTAPLYYHETLRPFFRSQYLRFVQPSEPEMLTVDVPRTKAISAANAIRNRIEDKTLVINDEWNQLDRAFVLDLLQQCGLMREIHYPGS